MRKKAKERMTVTVDPALVRVGNAAVARGSVSSLSAWVNAALIEHARKERQLVAMAEAVGAYEAQFGKITDEEIAEQERVDRKNRIVIGRRSKTPRRRGAA